MKTLSLAIALLAPAPLIAQSTMQAAQDSMTEASAYPATVSVRTGKAGPYYADAKGKTLYALSSRTVRARAGTTLGYCIGPCAKIWTPLAAPADAKPVGRWKVERATQGPQWSYSNDLVFTYNADLAPGDMAGDGYEDMWSIIAHIPPAPRLAAPAGVTARYVDAHYILSDTGGHALFVSAGACDAACATWSPFPAGMAARDMGDWTVRRDGDQARWVYRGKPVYVSQENIPGHAPSQGIILQP
ncbi:SCO0930 family lipoprotein [Sphingomonas oligophenolica]|uniref:Lipoprotein n=1 Tax=Sphingomonas oligophenolica TaxID=301154 RepID=A0ABU9Y3X1_9SPHN